MGRHRKYIQIIGHRKYKLIPTLIFGIVGIVIIVLFLRHLKDQYDISTLQPSSKTQIENSNQGGILQEDFVKGIEDKK